MRLVHGRSCRGFTLLEIILAMSLVSAIAVALASSLKIAYSARATAVRAAERARVPHVALERITHDIASALPPAGILAGSFLGFDAVQAAAGGELLAFYCMRPGRADYGPMADGIQRVSLVLTSLRDPVTGVTSSVLGRRVAQNLLSPSEPVYEDEILLRGVQACQVLYYDGTTWQETWDSTTLGNVLPTAVQISIAVRDPEKEKTEVEPYRVTRTVYLACSAPISTTEATGSSGASAGGGR